MNFILKPIFIFLLFCKTTFAFDPFSVSAVVGAGANTLSTLGAEVGEVTETLSAFEDFYSQMNETVQLTESAQKIIAQVNEINELIQDVGLTAKEVQDFGEQDVGELQSLAETFRYLTQMVRVGKNVSRLFSRLETRAKKAQIESTEIERQQLLVLYELLRSYRQDKMQEAKNQLKVLKEKKDSITSLRADLNKSKAQLFKRTSLMTFPKANSSFEAAIEVGKKMTPIFVLLLGACLGFRILMEQMKFGSANYANLIQSFFLSAFILYFYPELVRQLSYLADSVNETFLFGKIEPVSASTAFPRDLKKWSLSYFLKWDYLLALVQFFIFSVAHFFSTFIGMSVIFLIPFASVLFFLFQVNVIHHLFVLLTLVFFWPFLWNGFGFLSAELFNQIEREDPFKNFIYSVFVYIGQVASPLLILKIFSTSQLDHTLKPSFGSLDRFVKNVFSMNSKDLMKMNAESFIYPQAPSQNLISSKSGFLNQLKSRESQFYKPENSNREPSWKAEV